jgi:hypothetical protein
MDVATFDKKRLSSANGVVSNRRKLKSVRLGNKFENNVYKRDLSKHPNIFRHVNIQISSSM